MKAYKRKPDRVLYRIEVVVIFRILLVIFDTWFYI